MPRQTKNQSQKKSNQGYLYCLKTTSNGNIVYKLGKTVNLNGRHNQYKCGYPDAKFIFTCPPCSEVCKPYNFKDNYPKKILPDHHLAEKVLHILLHPYRLGQTECFDISEEKILEHFEEIKRMSVKRLAEIVRDKELWKRIAEIKKQRDELAEQLNGLRLNNDHFRSPMKFDTKRDSKTAKPEIHPETTVIQEDDSQIPPPPDFPEDEKVLDEPKSKVNTDDESDTETDDELDTDLSDSSVKVIDKISDGLLKPSGWGNAKIAKDFLELSISNQTDLLKFLEISGYSNTDDNERKDLLKKWYKKEKDLLVKCRFPFKYNLSKNVNESDQDDFLDSFIKKFDDDFHADLDDEKNPKYDDLFDNYLNDVIFQDNKTISGYLVLRLPVTYTEKNNKKIIKLQLKTIVKRAVKKIKGIASYIIEKLKSSEHFECGFQFKVDSAKAYYLIHEVFLRWIKYQL